MAATLLTLDVFQCVFFFLWICPVINIFLSLPNHPFLVFQALINIQDILMAWPLNQYLTELQNLEKYNALACHHPYARKVEYNWRWTTSSTTNAMENQWSWLIPFHIELLILNTLNITANSTWSAAYFPWIKKIIRWVVSEAHQFMMNMIIE